MEPIPGSSSPQKNCELLKRMKEIEGAIAENEQKLFDVLRNQHKTRHEFRHLANEFESINNNAAVQDEDQQELQQQNQTQLDADLPLSKGNSFLTDERENISPTSFSNDVIRSQDSNTCVEQEWFSGVKPLDTPYFPQLGDQVVYFRQGHKEYLDEIKNRNLYDVDQSDEPWSDLDLKAHEFAKIVEISYLMQPPRLCSLKLERDDKSCFKVKYRDLSGIVDFLVLRQIFDTARKIKWQVGDRFRYLVDEEWLFGRILEIGALDAQEFPDSLFKRLRIKWEDDKMEERISPWEIESVDPNRLPQNIGDSVAASQNEIRKRLYRPEVDEWPEDGRDRTCRRILTGFNHLIKLPITKKIRNLNENSLYATHVKYPIDLQTIYDRVNNHFYRRIEALRFDVTFLGESIKEIQDNDPTLIQDYIMTKDIMFKIIENPSDLDVHETYDNILRLDDMSNNESVYTMSQISQSQTGDQSQTLSPKSQNLTLNLPWRDACRKIFNKIWEHEDSKEFRTPVDLIEYPEYDKIITIKMDLSTVNEQFDTYKNASEFHKDMCIIFSNSIKFTPDKTTAIYKQTQRLKKVYDHLIENVIPSKKNKSAAKRKSNADSGDSDVIKSPKKRTDNSKAGPSTCRRIESDEDEEPPTKKINTRSKRLAQKKKRINEQVEQYCTISDESEENEDSDEMDEDLSTESDGSNEDSSVSEGSHMDEKIEDLADFFDTSFVENDDANANDEDSSLDETDKSIVFTSSSELRSYRLQQHVTVTGEVSEVNKTKLFVIARQEKTKHLSFTIDNHDGVRVRCKAWGTAANQHGPLIKPGRIIQIKGAVTVDKKIQYNFGNVNYMLLLKNYSVINILKR